METVLLQDAHIIRKDNMKKFIILLLILFAPKAFAFDGYVSPESYAVNEADLMDYKYIPASPKLNLELLETLDQPAAEVVVKKPKKVKEQKVSKKDDPEAYKKRLSYKVAKWWVDQRYKREEVHHGTKHEIKVKAREEYERRFNEKTE